MMTRSRLRELAPLEDRVDLLGVERLALEERVGERLERSRGLRDRSVLHLVVLALDDRADLLVDLAARSAPSSPARRWP